MAALLALALSACAGSAPRKAADTDFPAPAALEVFAAGYDNVTDKYLEPLPMRTVGLEAMRGLGAIDPAITVEPDGKDVRISGGGHEIAREPLPETDDPRAWAMVTVKASREARKWSDELRRADPEKIYEAVFDGMLSELDIYSRYSGREEARRNRARRDGFGGVGLRFRMVDGAPEIAYIRPNTPAERAGLTVGDVIVSVDGQPVSDMPVRRISDLLRGTVDTPVTLKLRRAKDDRDFSVTLIRQHIVPITVTDHMTDGVLYIDVTSFNQKTSDSVKQAIEEAKQAQGRNLKGVVLDMRGNPGGLLRQSVKLVNLFLTQGQIITTRGRNPDSIHHYNADGADILDGLPLAVLIDGKSASAAEIAAAALQDRNRAVLVGTSSYGKGSVQTVIRLPNDGELTITWSRLITPTGYILHGLGVHPAVCTSTGAGAGEDDPMAAKINDAKVQADLFARWRRPAVLNDDERALLRKACPPERHQDNRDLEIAKRIILSKSLYAQALSLTQTTVQAGARQAGW